MAELVDLIAGAASGASGTIVVGGVGLRVHPQAFDLVIGDRTIAVDEEPHAIGFRLARSSGEAPGLWQRIRGAKADALVHLEITGPTLPPVRVSTTLALPDGALASVPAAEGEWVPIDPGVFGTIVAALRRWGVGAAPPKAAPAELVARLHGAASAAATEGPGYTAWSALLKAAADATPDEVLGALGGIDASLADWPDSARSLTWSLADDVFREKKSVGAFLLVRHVDLAGVHQEPAKLFDGLVATGHRHRIRSLATGGFELGDAGLQRLAACGHLRTLRRLDLGNAGLSAAALTALRALPCASRLRALSLEGCRLGGVAALFAEPNPFASLEELNLEATELGDEDLLALAASPQLASLVTLRLARNPRVTAAGITALARAPFAARLRTLSIGGTLGAGVDALHALPGGALRELRVHEAQDVRLATLVVAPICGALQDLTLRRCALGPADAAAWAHLPRTLTNLDVSENEIGDAGLAAIVSRSTSLEELTADDCGLGPAFPVPSSAPAELSLSVEGNRLDAASVAALVRWPTKFTFLGLGRNGLDAAAITPLAGARFTEESGLDLSRNPLGPAGIDALSSVPFPPGFALFLEGCGIDDDVARKMAAAPAFSNVGYIDLDDNPLTRRGYRALIASEHFAAVKSLLEMSAEQLEDDVTAGVGASLEIRGRCRQCSQPLHVNALTNVVHCRACQADVGLSWDAWVKLLESPLADAPSLETGKGGRVQFLSGPAAGFEVEFGRFDPYCFACKNDFDPDALAEHVGRDYPCPKCKKPWRVRELPPAARARLPAIRLLVAEDPNALAQGRAEAPKPRPITFACPDCGGGLKVDGSDRMVPCGFCGANVFLPDELWLRLHPVSTVRRWFVWFGRT